MYDEAKEFATSVNAHYCETSVYSNIGKIWLISYMLIVLFKQI